MGRKPACLTEAQIEQVEGLASVLSKEQIADYFGVSRNTFAAMMERDQDIFARYKRGKAKAIGAVANGLLKQARRGNLTAAMFYLKTQAGWRESTRIEHSGPDGGPIQTEDVGARDKLADRIARIAAAGSPGGGDSGAV